GLVHTVTRPDFQARGCEWAGTNDTETFEFDSDGLLTKVTTARGRVEAIGYAADRLYPNSKKTTVTRYLDGAAMGATTLTSLFDFARRTGKPTLVQDPNGVQQLTERDSLGRPHLERLRTGPGLAAVLTLRQTTYSDTTTPFVDAIISRDVGVV